uniref:Interactor of constitutive active ROPs 2, chloroplastic-like n=1 Tax=Ananas comosus var. bracteatus TaxID=296719 RepID=A0A6V7QYX1_ANACO
MPLAFSLNPSRGSAAENRQRTSPNQPRSNRPFKAVGSDSSSASDNPAIKSPEGRSTKIIERRSPTSLEREKKRSIKMTDLEAQLLQLQGDLKKTKDQLISSESRKMRAQQEVQATKKQLEEFSTAEESRLFELRKISQERDRAWQSELEAIQKQHSVDSAEIQRLRMQLELVLKAQAAREKQFDEERLELEELKQDMADALSTIEDLKSRLRGSEKAEADAKALFEEAKQQLEASKGTIDTLLTDGSKLMDSFSLVVKELEESRARVKSLEEMVKSSQKLGTKELRSALGETEIMFFEEQILRIIQINYATESMEKMKIDSDQRETKLKTALESTKSEVILLKANLFDKDAEIRNLSDVNKKLQMELDREKMIQKESTLDSNIKEGLKAEATKLKEKLTDISEENEKLKLEIINREIENCKAHEEAVNDAKLARDREEAALMKLKTASEKAEENGKREAAAVEKLNKALETKSEMEAELRRVRVQAEQWRKAAEAAMAVLTVGNNNGGFLERTESLDSKSHSVAKKLMTTFPFSDDLGDDESASRKNSTTMLKRISGMWKK